VTGENKVANFESQDLQQFSKTEFQVLQKLFESIKTIQD